MCRALESIARQVLPKGGGGAVGWNDDEHAIVEHWTGSRCGLRAGP